MLINSEGSLLILHLDESVSVGESGSWKCPIIVVLGSIVLVSQVA